MSAIFPKGYSPNQNSKLGVSTILPADVARELSLASRSDLSERMFCIDRAVSRAKRNYPQFFQP